MRARLFLDLAKRLAIIPHEANWRCAAGRAYYALLLECRDALIRWGFSPPRSDAVHQFVRSRFVNTSDGDLRAIGAALEYLSRLRNRADYELTARHFTSDVAAKKAVREAEDALALLDVIDADAVRQAGAIADIQSHWP